VLQRGQFVGGFGDAQRSGKTPRARNGLRQRRKARGAIHGWIRWEVRRDCSKVCVVTL
jgi:hypothetical protein